MIIISNDCWGNNWYKNKKVEYNTPFIGAFVPPEDFVNLLKDFNSINDTIRFLPNKPITGVVANSRVVFLHYSNIEEAESKWYRRLGRLNRDFKESKVIYKLSIMSTGVYRHYPTKNHKELLENFHNMSKLCNKISFCDECFGPQPKIENHFSITKELAADAVTLWNITKQWPKVKNIIEN